VPCSCCCNSPQALSIPVIANGNIRTLKDANDCMAYTGCDGVLSAESLLVDPALFSPSREIPGVRGWGGKDRTFQL
jgi:tRNA-dihydrouridine synthase